MAVTPTKGYTKPTVGADFNVWGNELNTNFDYIDSNIGGVTSVDVSGNVDVTASASQARCMLQDLTGTLTGDISYILPNTSGYYAIANNAGGAFNLFVKTVSGTGIYVAPGSSMWVYSDGANIVRATPVGWQVIATYTISGAASTAILLPTFFRRFRLTLQNGTVNAATANFQLQFSSDKGSTFFNTNYVYTVLNVDSAGTVTPGGSTVAGAIPLSTSLVAGGTGVADFTYEVFPGSASARATLRGSIFCNSTTAFVEEFISGNYSGGLALMNALAIQASSGTMSGTVILEGLP